MYVRKNARRNAVALALAGSYAALIVATAVLSLFDLNIFEGRNAFAGLGNYAKAFRDRSLEASIELTLTYAFVASILSLGIAGILALGLRKLAINPFVVCTSLVPWFLPPTTVGVLFQLLLDFEQGPLSRGLSVLAGGRKLNILGDPQGMFWALVMADIWQWVGILTFAFALLSRSVDRGGLDVVAVFGGRSSERLLGWWIPVLIPSVVVLAAVKFFWTLADFDRISTLTNHGGPFGSMRVFGIWVERAYFNYGDFGYGASASILLLIIALLMSWPLSLFVLRRS